MPTHVDDNGFPAFDIDEAMEVNENMEASNYDPENIRSGEHRICLSFSTAVDENGNGTFCVSWQAVFGLSTIKREHRGVRKEKTRRQDTACWADHRGRKGAIGRE